MDMYIQHWCCGYSLAVFVGWFVVVDWESGLIFTLRHLITILSHELIKIQREIMQRYVHDMSAHLPIVS